MHGRQRRSRREPVRAVAEPYARRTPSGYPRRAIAQLVLCNGPALRAISRLPSRHAQHRDGFSRGYRVRRGRHAAVAFGAAGPELDAGLPTCALAPTERSGDGGLELQRADHLDDGTRLELGDGRRGEAPQSATDARGTAGPAIRQQQGPQRDGPYQPAVSPQEEHGHARCPRQQRDHRDQDQVDWAHGAVPYMRLSTTCHTRERCRTVGAFVASPPNAPGASSRAGSPRRGLRLTRPRSREPESSSTGAGALR